MAWPNNTKGAVQRYEYLRENQKLPNCTRPTQQEGNHTCYGKPSPRASYVTGHREKYTTSTLLNKHNPPTTFFIFSVILKDECSLHPSLSKLLFVTDEYHYRESQPIKNEEICGAQYQWIQL